MLFAWLVQTMKSLSVREISAAVGGKILNCDENKIVLNISTDSRDILKGDLFIPLKGENFDGHEFIDTAFEKGAVCALSEIEINTQKTYIKVDNTKKALADLAEYYRNLFDIPVAAVTGSVGKTTTKDIIYSVLGQKFNTVKTDGNFNNEIGVPLTIFKIEENTEAAVIEMGMNHFGEIRRLCKMVKPDAAVITNVGYSHIENLGSREGILKAKCEIFDFLKEEGLKILNGDDDMLMTLKGREKNTCFYGTANYSYDENDFYADEIAEKGIDGISFRVHKGSESFWANIETPGRHMVLNTLAAAAVGDYFGLNFEQIKKGVESFEPTKMRMDVIRTDKYTIINDVYNANPVSMKAGIDVLSESSLRKVCILGDMFELGDFAPKLHFEVGEYACQKNIDVIICIGNISKNIYEGALKRAALDNIDAKNIFYFKTQEKFFAEIDDILKNNDIILVKASRGMKFEKTVEKIKR